MLGNRLIIGIDYGTTYTGVSFCETSDTGFIEERIQVVQDWPSAHSMIGTKEKVPSEIAYPSGGGDVLWGSLIQPKMKRHMWTKLELDSPKTGEAGKIREELEALFIASASKYKQPVEIVANFLAKVKIHLMKNLDTQYGKELWRTLPITLVITVPAVWSDLAKDRTLQAVKLAGFNQTEFPQLRRTVTITEPEAAAIYTIKSLRGTAQDQQLQVDDGFIVCDMGGGTVDLISYRVASIEPTTVQEATIGTGDQCGGSFVDRGFLQWLQNKLGVDDFLKIAGQRVDQLSRTSLPPKLGRMIQDFTLTCKSGFSGTEDYYLRLPAPLTMIEDDERGMCDGEIRITAMDMIQMFEFPLRKTRELLLEQLQQSQRNSKTKMKYVFMVGGFAESPYMYRQIHAMAQAYSIVTIKPAYAWSAIVRGATAKGLEGDGRTPIAYRKCRRHYGTNCNEPFVPGYHREADSCICGFTGEKHAQYQMRWIIRKGHELETSKKYHGEHSFFSNFWAGQARMANIALLAANVNRAPRLEKDQSVYKVAELVIDLSSVPESEFKRMHSHTGALYHRLDFKVRVSVQSALEYTFVVNGTQYGSITANYAA